MSVVPVPCSLGAFNSLPIELNQYIGLYLHSDRDINTYRSICRSTKDAVEADGGTFWRRLFRSKYAVPFGAANYDLKETYKQRALFLRLGVMYDFFRGNIAREVKVMRVLRGLINDTFADGFELDEHGRPRCRNQAILANFVLCSKILLNRKRAGPAKRHEPSSVNPALAAIKIMCAHFLLENLDIGVDPLAFEESQHEVYKPTKSAPIYKGQGQNVVNMDWVLHCLNFFRHHMVNGEASSMPDAIDTLAPTQRPSAWEGPLRKGSYPLGKYWKGTYAFLHNYEIERFRNREGDDIAEEFFIDNNVDEGKIHTLELNFNEGAELVWPKLFEEKLPSQGNRIEFHPEVQGHKKTANDASSKNLQFTGKGLGLEDDFKCLGWLNPLPVQEGIPGWQRITFMKYSMDDLSQAVHDNLWAYEGVVLPGGRIILGRWWHASDDVIDFTDDYSGPFILWATAEPEFECGDKDKNEF